VGSLSITTIFAQPVAQSDTIIVQQWLHSRSPHTQRAYSRDVATLFAFTSTSIRSTTLSQLQAYADSLAGSPATRARRLMAAKSLFSFAAKLGYIPFNVGAALIAPRPSNQLAERILSEEEVLRLLAAVVSHQRDHVMLRVLYSGGLRVSEAAGLRWRNCVDGYLNVTGKGGRTRVVRLSTGTWDELIAIRPAGEVAEQRVFGLQAWGVWRRVRRAADRAGLRAVSPHFLRHAHATHALHRGADLATVSATLGHAGAATTSRYLHARPNRSSGDWLGV